MTDYNTSVLLDALIDPAILVDQQRRIVAANKVAQSLLGALTVGSDLATRLRYPAALDAVDAVLGGEDGVDATVVHGAPVQQIFEMRVASLPEDRPDRARAFCLLRDVTATREIERMRADFVANVSHELRSPLSSLLGFIETLNGPARDDAAARTRFLNIMDGEAKRMARLVDDLLSLSRVVANEHVPPTGRVDLAGLLSEIADTVTTRAGDKDMQIKLDVDPQLPKVPGDRDELHEVFQNLVDNGVKYGRTDTSVDVVVRGDVRIPDVGDQGVAVSVINQGDVIAPEHLPRLTERFYRIDKGRSRDMGGTGLGLAIVKHIVNHHRGRLTIESDQESGNVFTVFLPKK